MTAFIHVIIMIIIIKMIIIMIMMIIMIQAALPCLQQDHNI